MAIGITGNGRITVCPRIWAHSFHPITPSDVSNLRTFVSGCVDVANKKCYTGSGTTITDFVSGVTFSMYGNSGNVVFKTDNVGILEITGNGYVSSNEKKYFFPGNESTCGFALDFWVYAATGHTQEEGILQFGEYDGGTFKNGIKIYRRYSPTSATLRRQLRVEVYGSGGVMSSFTTASQGHFYADEWNHISFSLSMQRIGIPFEEFAGYNIQLRSKTIREILENDDAGSNTDSSAFAASQGLEVNRFLKIGQVDGITGNFKGKFGAIKLYNNFATNFDTLDPDASDAILPSTGKKNYKALAPRYDQYD